MRRSVVHGTSCDTRDELDVRTADRMHATPDEHAELLDLVAFAAPPLYREAQCPARPPPTGGGRAECQADPPSAD